MEDLALLLEKKERVFISNGSDVMKRHKTIYEYLFVGLLLMAAISCNVRIQLFDNDIDGNNYGSNSFEPFFQDKPYYYHYAPNGFVKDGEGKKAIASESIQDIEFASRLGFSMIEANIHKTSDGHFVCIHGSHGEFGPEVKSINEEVILTDALRKTAISSVSLDFIKAYIRYDSDYEEFQTTIPSLEEFCQACLDNKIGLFAGTRDELAVKICQQYMGDNLIIYGFPSNVRQYFDGYLYTWNNAESISQETLLNTAERFGNPYICGIGPELWRAMEEEHCLDSFIESMHVKDCLVSIAAVYQSEEDVRDAIRKGVDCFAAGHEVNPFEPNYEKYGLDSETNKPFTTGRINGCDMNLDKGDVISCGNKEKIIGKGYLKIQFKGDLTICFGSCGSYNRTISSDGSEIIEISDYFFNNQSQLTILANSNTIISFFSYFTSKC